MQTDKICTKIARELNLDKELVKKIVMYEFRFTTDVMKDPEDYHDILFNKLFRFTLKPRFKVDKTKKYSPK
jgi:hypothetical protein